MTKLVPKLTPQEECVDVPKELCETTQVIETFFFEKLKILEHFQRFSAHMSSRRLYFYNIKV